MIYIQLAVTETVLDPSEGSEPVWIMKGNITVNAFRLIEAKTSHREKLRRQSR